MTRLHVTAHANRDLDVILDYLDTVSGARTSASYAERIAETLDRISQFPGSGAPRPALGPQARIALVLPYVLIYDYAEPSDEVVLLRVLHGRRNITERLLGRP